MQHIVLPNNVLLDNVVNLINENNNVKINVKGRSMSPFIIDNIDKVILEKCDSPQKYDIVLAKTFDKKYVLHRIYEIDKNKITLMGDGNIKGKEYCYITDIGGKAIYIEHNGKLIDCNSQRELIKAKIWRLLLPIRRYLLAIWRRTYNLKTGNNEN